MKYVIGNVDCEGMVGSHALIPTCAIGTTVLSAKRMVWFLEDGDTLILPNPPHSELITEVESVIGTQLSNCTFRSPDESTTEKPCALTSTIVGIELTNLLQSSLPPNKIISYFPSAQVLRKQASLFDHLCASNSFMLQGGGELLNTKAFFRIAFGSHVPMAEGYVCRSLQDLEEVSLDLLSKGKDIILKQSLNAGGDGNVAICSQVREQLFGVSKSYTKISDFELKPLLVQLWKQMGDAGLEQTLVVEEYCLAESVLFAEYEIEPDSSTYLGHGEMRFDITSSAPALLPGFCIPAQIKEDVRNVFLDAVFSVAEKCRELGYVGRINVDGVLCTNGKPILTEINARFGGCSHIFHIAQKLLGDNFYEQFVITTRSFVRCPDLAAAIQIARKIRDEVPSRGVVVANEDMSGSKTIQVLSYGASLQECETIESEFIQRLQTSELIEYS